MVPRHNVLTCLLLVSFFIASYPHDSVFPPPPSPSEWTGRLRHQQKGVILQPAFSDNLLLFSKKIKLKDIVGPDLENLRSTRNVPDLQCQPEHLHFLTFSYFSKLIS